MAPLTSLRDLNKLHAFVRVAERRSFTKAAEDLRTTPSVLSKHISELERSLGFTVLSRSTRGVALTEAGEGLLRTFLQALSGLDDYVVETRNSQTGPYGSLRIQATSGYARWILAPLVSEFLSRNPHLRVQISAQAATLGSIEDGYDVLIASKKPPIPGLVEREIGIVEHVVCASPDYLRRAGRPQVPRDLRQHNCLVNSYFAPKEWKFRMGSQIVAVDVKGTFSSNSSAVLIRVSMDSVGIVRVPRQSVRRELQEGSLQTLFEDLSVSTERMRVYFPKMRRLPAKLTDFVQFLEETTRAR